MIYNLNINYTEDGAAKTYKLILDSSIFNITYSNLSEKSEYMAESNQLSFGTIDNTMKLTQAWKDLKKIAPKDITSIVFLDEEDIVIYEFTQEVYNIIYNINFNKPGDMIIFDFGE